MDKQILHKTAAPGARFAYIDVHARVRGEDSQAGAEGVRSMPHQKDKL
jgi:hypothetical protein